MIKIINKQDCCGCTACASVCPVNAIEMKPDELGFLYPAVSASICIECNKCDKVCGFLSPDLRNDIPVAYGVRHKKIREVEKSRSGAAFAALSDYFLKNGGVVYGAGYDAHFKVKHKRADDRDKRDDLRGSKYAQSDMTGVMSIIKQDLKEGNEVLFSGTPCQVYALKLFIPAVLQKKLFTIDIVCHGVSSPKVWDDYLLYLEKKEKKDILSVNFRDKSIFGWSGLHKESFTFSDNVKRTYDYTYYSDLIVRPSCNECRFASVHRGSDLTLADFWGWKKLCPEFEDDDKGYSLLLVNTDKGDSLFRSVGDSIIHKQVDIMQCIQPNMQQPTAANSKHEQFVSDYVTKGFAYVRRKYGVVGIRYQMTRIINYVKRHFQISV